MRSTPSGAEGFRFTPKTAPWWRRSWADWISCFLSLSYVLLACFQIWAWIGKEGRRKELDSVPCDRVLASTLACLLRSGAADMMLGESFGDCFPPHPPRMSVRWYHSWCSLRGCRSWSCFKIDAGNPHRSQGPVNTGAVLRSSTGAVLNDGFAVRYRCPSQFSSPFLLRCIPKVAAIHALLA